MNGKIFSAIIIGIIGIIVLAFYFNQDSFYNVEGLRKFESQSDLENYIKDSISSNSNYAVAPGARGGESKTESVDAFASDYSQTNIQVDGVGELDIVKNDGKYIYSVSQNKIIITEAYPANSMKIIAELEFDNYVSGIFVEDGKLITIESSYGYMLYSGLDSAKIAGIAPSESYVNDVKLRVYDLENITNLQLLETFSLEGSYSAARFIDGYVYVIANKYIDYANPATPEFKQGELVDRVDVSSIYYPPYYDSNLIFTSIMAIDVEDLKYSADVFLVGSSSAIYVSEDAIYLASPKTYDYTKLEEERLRFVVEALPNNLKSEAQEVLDSNEEYYVKSDKIALIVQKYFNSLTLGEKEEFQQNIADAYTEVSKKYESTLINKIEINDLDIDYSGSGEVPGYILNQFSMDEFEGNFRIATTTGNIFGNFEGSLNHLYILNDDLKIVGAVEDLAQGERIYSARFLGDKAYMVTFRQIDPLYVIDLSDVSDPKVLGYLKVTGFSNYLHPIEDNLLLGIGHEATDEGRSQGLKISLFDVSDFENPKELDKYVVEAEWSYSEAEYEHKAILFDDKKDLLVIPVSYSSNTKDNWQWWQGAFVFSVTDEEVSLKGKISHDIKTEKEQNYGSGQYYVHRSIYMDDILYTISQQMIKANKIEDLSFVSEVELPAEDYVYPVYWAN